MTEEKLTVLQKMQKVIKGITVEPPSILLLTGTILASTASQTLNIEKTFRVNLNLSDAICDALRNQDSNDNVENERMVQEYVARLLAYKTIITSVLPCILLIFVGGWMDITGRRKIIMLLAIIGEILAQLNNIINVIFFHQLKVEFLIFFDAIFSSMFGATTIFVLAVFSFIVDITTEQNRTYRLGLVNFCIFVGLPIGVAISGVLLKNFGYLTVYITALSVAVFNACYVIFFISDPARNKEHKEHDNRGFIYFMKLFFNPAHLLNSLKVVFKKTTNNRTLRLCILFVVSCFLFGPLYGESSIMYLSTRYRFGWDELQYSLFQTYNMVLNIIGGMFCILLISMKLGWHDSVLGIISSISKIAGAMVYCFAATGTIFYLGPLADIFNGSAALALRSIFSKTVETDEIGKLNSIIGIFEVLLPLAYVPLYTQVYTATIEFMPGFVFLMGSFLTIPPLMIFTWLFYRHLKSVTSEKDIVSAL